MDCSDCCERASGAIRMNRMMENNLAYVDMNRDRWLKFEGAEYGEASWRGLVHRTSRARKMRLNPAGRTQQAAGRAISALAASQARGRPATDSATLNVSSWRLPTGARTREERRGIHVFSSYAHGPRTGLRTRDVFCRRRHGRERATGTAHRLAIAGVLAARHRWQDLHRQEFHQRLPGHHLHLRALPDSAGLRRAHQEAG